MYSIIFIVLLNNGCSRNIERKNGNFLLSNQYKFFKFFDKSIIVQLVGTVGI